MKIKTRLPSGIETQVIKFNAAPLQLPRQPLKVFLTVHRCSDCRLFFKLVSWAKLQKSDTESSLDRVGFSLSRNFRTRLGTDTPDISFKSRERICSGNNETFQPMSKQKNISSWNSSSDKKRRKTIWEKYFRGSDFLLFLCNVGAIFCNYFKAINSPIGDILDATPRDSFSPSTDEPTLLYQLHTICGLHRTCGSRYFNQEYNVYQVMLGQGSLI